MTAATPLKPGAEPLAIDGGRIGVVLSHGFTGSPASMKPWGHHLADLGYTVRVPRLPGHGTTWQELNTKRWDDWYSELDAALTELRSTCDQVAVCGLSMGGGLGLRLAEQRPDDVDALILVNPAIQVRNWQLKALPALKYVLPSIPGITNDIKKPDADESGYARTPLRALHSQVAAWQSIRDDLPKITTPLLMFRSVDDHVVDDTSLALIRHGVSSPVAEFITLTDSYHVATLDFDAPLIFDRSADFLATHLGSPR